MRYVANCYSENDWGVYDAKDKTVLCSGMTEHAAKAKAERCNFPDCFNVMINEEQRALLATACDLVVSLQLPVKLSAEQREELSLLHGMLVDLPEIEKDSPGATHGFCL